MPQEYKASNQRLGPVVEGPPPQESVTLRLNPGTVAWFQNQARQTDNETYQSLMHQALQFYIDAQEESKESMETLLRRVLREELGGRHRIHP